MSAANFSQRVPATADQLPHVRSQVLAFADAHYPDAERDRQNIALAVTEACANAVLHAYPDNTGELTVTAHTDDHHLIIHISDHGIGIHHANGTNRPGLGVPLMHALANTHITTNGHGTTTKLSFPR
jgi:serine/threonine-protein kinase RsbW